MKAKALEVTDTVGAADVLWMKAVRPALLYAAEVITYDKGWIKMLETIQNKLGRWMIGTSQGSACAGVRGELGWVTIQGEIMKRQIQYLGKLRNMSAGRWPREV